MLFQTNEETLIYVLAIIIATVIIGLIIYITVILIESKHKASDKAIMIFLLALIIVVVIPIILAIIAMVLDAIGDPLTQLRDPPTHNFLLYLVPIFGFLLILICAKFFIDLNWSSSLWIALLAIFFLYIIFTIIPELYTFIYGLAGQGAPPI
ncbi:MAG: hypothetical protein KGD57_08505 [Candidatus Lokiarchaeota archaeon]|nr:hypothetical protein [Candidatus Lokiarchaeota archaeon]